MGNQETTQATAAIQIHRKAARWKLIRREGDKWPSCSLQQGGMQIDWFDVAAFPPTIELVRDLWGNGSYRVAWYAKDNKPLGQHRIFTIDDPSTPARPLYHKAPVAPEPPPEPPAPSPPFDPQELMKLLAPQAGGQASMLAVLPLLLPIAARAWQWIQEERERYDRRLAQEREQITREAEARAVAQVESMKTLYEAINKTARAPDPMIERLLAKVEDLEEQVDQADQSPTQQLVAQLLPHAPQLVGVLQSFANKMNGAAALPGVK